VSPESGSRSVSEASPALEADVQGLTYSGGCQLLCRSLPLSMSSCIYLAFAVNSVRPQSSPAGAQPFAVTF
jgi:hypothetical protein